MEKIELGKTSEKVSVMALGCMYYGTKTDKTTSNRLLDTFFETGGNFFDTANNYAFWVEGFSGDESETLLGNWMLERKNRHDIFLATKVGGRPTVPGEFLDKAEGLSAKAIKAAIEDSLKRLKTDYVDLYYVHIEDRSVALEETLEALDRLVKEGKVRFIGCSNHPTWRIERARNISNKNHWNSYCCVQQRFSYLQPHSGAQFVGGYQKVAGEELLDYCRVNEDFSLIAYSPLLGGAYTREDVVLPESYYSLQTDERNRALKQVCSETDATPNQVVLSWMIQGNPPIIPILGTSSVEQLTENLGAAEVDLTDHQIETLTQAGI